jgi:tripartite-type tricarboxylate transporter receptor subunit TctC
MPQEAVDYWIGRFEKLTHTASWKKYLEDNELEAAFVPGPAFRKSMEETSAGLREQFLKSGIKVVR